MCLHLQFQYGILKLKKEGQIFTNSLQTTVPHNVPSLHPIERSQEEEGKEGCETPCQQQGSKNPPKFHPPKPEFLEKTQKILEILKNTILGSF